MPRSRWPLQSQRAWVFRRPPSKGCPEPWFHRRWRPSATGRGPSAPARHETEALRPRPRALERDRDLRSRQPLGPSTARSLGPASAAGHACRRERRRRWLADCREVLGVRRIDGGVPGRRVGYLARRVHLLKIGRLRIRWTRTLDGPRTRRVDIRLGPRCGAIRIQILQLLQGRAGHGSGAGGRRGRRGCRGCLRRTRRWRIAA